MKIAKIKIPEPGSEEKYPGCFNRDTLRLSQVFWKEITDKEFGSLSDTEKLMFEFADIIDSSVKETIESGKIPEYGKGFPIKLIPKDDRVERKTVDLKENILAEGKPAHPSGDLNPTENETIEKRGMLEARKPNEENKKSYGRKKVSK